MNDATPTTATATTPAPAADNSEFVERPAGEIELTRRNLIGLRVSVLAGLVATGVSVVGAMSGPTVTSVC